MKQLYVEALLSSAQALGFPLAFALQGFLVALN